MRGGSEWSGHRGIGFGLFSATIVCFQDVSLLGVLRRVTVQLSKLASTATRASQAVTTWVPKWLSTSSVLAPGFHRSLFAWQVCLYADWAAKSDDASPSADGALRVMRSSLAHASRMTAPWHFTVPYARSKVMLFCIISISLAVEAGTDADVAQRSSILPLGAAAATHETDGDAASASEVKGGASAGSRSCTEARTPSQRVATPAEALEALGLAYTAAKTGEMPLSPSAAQGDRAGTGWGGMTF